MWQNYIGLDKVKHFLVNLIGVIVITNIGLFLCCSFLFSLIIAVLSMVIISIIKEVMDVKTTGFSVPDLVADSLGIIVAILLLTLI